MKDHKHCSCHHEDSNEYSKGETSLYSKIDIDNVQCLNEAIENSGKYVFKPYEHSFTGHVKIKSLVIIGSDDETYPSEIRIYKNRPHISFDDTKMEPDQSFKLYPDPIGELEYNLKALIFSSVYNLALFFPSSSGAPNTKIYYIGLYGEYLRPFRQEITICNYEATANPCDHKVKEDTSNQMQIH